MYSTLCNSPGELIRFTPWLKADIFIVGPVLNWEEDSRADHVIANRDGLKTNSERVITVWMRKICADWK